MTKVVRVWSIGGSIPEPAIQPVVTIRSATIRNHNRQTVERRIERPPWCAGVPREGPQFVIYIRCDNFRRGWDTYAVPHKATDNGQAHDVHQRKAAPLALFAIVVAFEPDLPLIEPIPECLLSDASGVSRKAERDLGTCNRAHNQISFTGGLYQNSPLRRILRASEDARQSKLFREGEI